MHKTTPRSIALLAALALLSAVPVSAQFNKYVALGDSLTAGFEGLCLVQRNQLASYPAVIARQLGITDFQQPLVSELPLSNPLVSNPCKGAVFVPPSTITVGDISQQGSPLNLLLGRPYDNLGIVGADTGDLVDLTESDPNGDTANRFGALVLRNSVGAPFHGLSAVDEANLLGPDLVSLWIGNNDISGAFQSGLFLEGVTTTPIPIFEAKYQEVIDGLSASGRTLAVANIPDVTAVPFTTTIPPVVLDPATRQPLIVDGHTVPLLGPGNEAFPCDPASPCSLPPGTLVTLPASALLAQGIGIPAFVGGTGLGLPDGAFIPPATVSPGVLLYPDEVAAIQARVDAYNQIIAAEVAGAGGILVDAHTIFNDIAAHGYEIGGITLTRSFLSGGLFSADGFHLSNIGYTLVADEFIKALNDAGFAVPRPDWSGVLFRPNVPNQVPAVLDGGLWGFSLSTWRELLAQSPALSGYEIRMPEKPRRGERATRIVTRD
jgi:GDSL-like lipase/acylhydrolase family protein